MSHRKDRERAIKGLVYRNGVLVDQRETLKVLEQAKPLPKKRGRPKKTVEAVK